MRRSNFLTVILILILLVLAYLWYSYLKNRPPSAVRTVNTVPSAGREFLELLKTLEAVKIDASLLSSPVFQSLREGGALPLEASPRGRVNPFAPLR